MGEIELSEIELNSNEFDLHYEKWKEDIAFFIPDFDIEDAYYSKVFLLQFEDQAAGLFIYQEKGDQIHIILDYLAKEFRNKGIGKKIFEDIVVQFKEQGFKLIVGLAYNPDHVNYLKELGFSGSSKHKARYELSLK